MFYDEANYYDILKDNNVKSANCGSDNSLASDVSELSVITGKAIIERTNIEHAATYCLETKSFLSAEFSKLPFNETPLKRYQIISVNPGANNLGREQRYLHYYIVLADYKDMFIGVPVTHMAFDRLNNTYYLRNPFEAELKNPSSDFSVKPYNEFWIKKPSVADIRNISGLDKRRIVNDNLFKTPKYAPEAHVISVKKKIIELFNLSTNQFQLTK